MLYNNTISVLEEIESFLGLSAHKWNQKIYPQFLRVLMVIEIFHLKIDKL